MKQLIIDKEHPNGTVRDIPQTESDAHYDTPPTAEERLAALEAAVLSMVLGGAANG